MRNQRGFTLTEVLLSAGLMALVAIGVGAIMLDSFKQTQNAITRGASTEFADSFLKWLHTSNGCVAALQGKVLPNLETPLSVNGFGAIASQLPVTATPPVIASGLVINPQLSIKSLTFKEKPGLVGPIRYNGIDLNQKVVQISLQMQTNTLNQPQSVRENIIEISVAVNPGQVIQFCNVELSQEQICMAQNSKWDPVIGQCVPVEACTIMGRFARAKSNPASQCCAHYSFPWKNHITLNSTCPVGSVEQFIGEKYNGNSRTYSCGKKCTAPIQDWEDFYVCLKCP